MKKALNHHELNVNYQEGKLDDDFYISVLEDPYSVRNLYYRDNLGEPYGAIESALKILDDNSPDIFNLNVRLLENPHSIINASIFTSSQFSGNIDYFASSVLNLSFSASVKILSHANNFNALYEYIHNNEADKISKGFLFAFTFCAIKKAVEFDPSHFIKNIPSIDEKEKIFVENIFRANNRKKEYKLKKSIKSKLKIALFVSGQVRSDLSIHENLPGMLVGNNDNQVDLFFSSWRKKGISKISEAKSPRFFTKEARDLVADNLGGMQSLNLDYFNSLLFEKINKLDINEVESSFSFCENKFINIDDESCPPFSEMSNPEKMYYHNSSWVNKLGEDYFNDYDLVIKIRPDIELKSFSPQKVLDKISDFEFMTDYKGEWIYKIWGLGVGDQVFMSSPNVMTGLLGMYSLSRQDAFSKKLLVDLKQPPYSGHVNLAIRALELGYKPIENDCFSIALHDGYKFSKEDVSNYLRDRALLDVK